MSPKGDACWYEAGGNLCVSYLYDEWGNLLSSETYTNAGATACSLNSLLYRGYYFDSETGFYYVSSRYYDPEIGRFINADDIDYLGADGSPLSYNLFAYCENNPVIRSDSTGQWFGLDDLIAGAVVSKAVPVKVSGITSGRNSRNAVFKSGLTKLGNKTASKMSIKVVGKGIASGFVANLGLAFGMGVKSFISNSWQSYQKRQTATPTGPLYWCAP